MVFQPEKKMNRTYYVFEPGQQYLEVMEVLPVGVVP